MSGKWDERGDTRGKYCMARFNDAGPYSTDNVKIILFEDNTREVHDNQRERQRAEASTTKL